VIVSEQSKRWQDEETIREVVSSAQTIAVVGLSPRESRDSHMVARYLREQGYRVIPVNPNTDEVLGEKSYPSLTDVPDTIDLVNVFRRPEFVPDIAREAVEVGAKVIWMQIGVVNDEAARIAAVGGLKVVMDRCLMVEHRRIAS
jgi:uncharacterized protein